MVKVIKSGLVFQITEILDDLKEVNSLGLEVIRGHLDELKYLRVNIVKVNSELRLFVDIVLKRKEMKNSYSVEFNRLVLLMDRLLQYTDVQFPGKDTMLNNQFESQARIEVKKLKFEEKLCEDIEKFDLSDQKLRLATQTNVDIGKFSGSYEKGLDYYTFKTKFYKAYMNHPKSLLVKWLVNNHLEGRAKDCVGSLEDLDEIWTRLKNNFGNNAIKKELMNR